MASSSEGLRILCLDGGGYRGLSTLLVLNSLMTRYKERLQLDEVPRPCDVFDYVIGTSTGGLIALLVGRLGLSAAEAIQIYKNLGKEVFSSATTLAEWLASGRGQFDANKLAKCIESVVPKNDGILFQERPWVRMAVTTVLVDHPSAEPILLRNYINKHGAVPPSKDHAWTIVEAARATSAAPTFFEPLVVNGTAYQDAGAGGFNNPALAALMEIGRIEEWRNKHICAFISLGTGISAKLYNPASDAPEMLSSRGVVDFVLKYARKVKGVADTSVDAMKVLVNAPGAYERFSRTLDYLTDIASDSERAHVFVQALHRQAYFRFNVPVDPLGAPGGKIERKPVQIPDNKTDVALGDIKLSDVAAEGEILDLTEKYLLDTEVVEYMNKAVERLDKNWNSEV